MSAALTTWISLALRLLNFGAVLPIVLKKFPVAEINLWMIFSSILYITTIADLGFSSAFLRHIAKFDFGCQLLDEEIHATISAMKKIYHIIAVVFLIAALIIGTYLVETPISLTNNKIQNWFGWILVLAGCVSIIYYNKYSTFMIGARRLEELRKWEIIFGSVNLIAVFFILSLSDSFLMLIAVTQVSTILSMVVISAVCKHSFPEWNKKLSDKYNVRNTLRYLRPIALKSGLGIIMSIGSIQIIGLIYGRINENAEDVASYLISIQIIQTLSMLAYVPFSNKIPHFIRLYSTDKIHQLKRELKNTIIIVTTLYLVGLFFIIIFINPILTLLGSNIARLGQDMLIMLGIAFLLHRVGAMHLQAYTISGDIVWHIADGVTGAVILIAFPILYTLYGKDGLPISMIIGFGLFYLPYSNIKYMNYIRTLKEPNDCD